MFKQFFTYNAVGIANTVLGFSIIVILMSIGISPIVSNMIGYGVGAIFSFYLNSKYTFTTTHNNVTHIIKFFMVLAMAYLINLLTLQILLELIHPYLAQFISAVSYTGSSFIFMKLFVFTH